ncbi:MAG: hypothetical protein IPN79_05865 [Saprospiraceae bacterium]|nr:hypothetical protein [Saprospiraceae bacterium]
MNPIKNKIQQFESTENSGLDKNKNWENILSRLDTEKKQQNKKYLYIGILGLCSILSFLFGYRMGVDHHQTIPDQQLPERHDSIRIQERTVVKTDTLYVTIEKKSPGLKTLKKIQTPKRDTFETIAPTLVLINKADTLVDEYKFLPTKQKDSQEETVIQVVESNMISPHKSGRTKKTYALPVFISDTTKIKEVRTKWMWSSQGLMYSTSVKRQ